MKTAILGSGGQLAFDLQRAMADWPLVPLGHAKLDICDYARMREVLREIQPEAVLNAAAFVRVDDCEDQVEKAFQVNAFAVRQLALICAELDCLLVHFSTDYVFDGEQRTPYGEEDLPNPLNVYGVSKLAGEYFVRDLCPKHLVVRSSGLYGSAGTNGRSRNFVEKIIRLAEEGNPISVVTDQVLSPTSTKDLAEMVARLIKKRIYGLSHVINRGECSWYEFAAKIFEITGIRSDLRPTTAVAYGANALRPAYSAMRSNRSEINDTTLMPRWEHALAWYLQSR